MDPSARQRLVEIIANLKDRVQDAKLNGWLGEVAGLETSLNEAARKLISLDWTKNRASGRVDLGIPVITIEQHNGRVASPVVTRSAVGGASTPASRD